jgi:PAS domain S-box-containing protein
MAVIKNKPTLQQHERALAEVQLFTAIASVAASEDDLPQILHAALEHLKQVIPFTGGSIALVDGDALVICAAYGPFATAALGYRMPRNGGPSWRVIETGQTFVSNDLNGNNWYGTSAFRSYIAAPLVWRGQVIGLLEVDSVEVNAFTAHDARLLEKVALLLCGPMELARQVHDLRIEIAEHKRTEQRLAVQHSVTRVVAESNNFAEAAPQIIQVIGETLGWDLGLIWCIDRKARILKCSTIWHVDSVVAPEFEALSRQMTIASGIGLPGRVWASGQPLWIADVLNEPSFLRMQAAAKAGLHGSFSFPIRGHHEIFGTIEFFTRDIQSPDEELLNMAEALGTQIGQFIDRKRAEIAQSESEKHRSAILETALDAIVGMNHEGRITEFNPTAEQMFGYSRADALGQEMAMMIIPPTLREQHRQGLKRYLETDINTVLGRRIEITAMRADGSEFPVELAITRIPSDGPPIFAGYIRDITERKRSEEAIRFQAQLLDVVEQAVIATSVDGTITYWNRFAETLYGWTAADVLGRNILDVTPAERARADAATIMARLQTGESWSGERLVQRRDRSAFPALVTESPIYGSDSHVIGIVGISTDISERKHAEESLRLLAESSSVLVSSLDYEPTLLSVARMAIPFLADWCIIDLLEEDGSIRQTAVAHADLTKEPLIRELRQCYPPDPNEPHVIWQVLRSGQAVVSSHINEDQLAARAQNATHLKLLQALAIRAHMIVPLGARGRMLGVISLISSQPGRYTAADLTLAEDLARRAALAIDNARLYHEAQDAIAMRDEFLSIASHELKTPLTTLLGHTQALQRRMARDQMLNERDQRAVNVIDQQARRLSKQIETLLDLSRIELGQFSMSWEAVDMTTLTGRIVAELEPTLERHTFDVTLPALPMIVAGDPARLEQVLLNLLHNAIKYSPNGGTITLRVEHENDHAVIMIGDQGVGIPESARPHLFQRFYRASNISARHISGMGIGLYLVNQIVLRHHGSIEYTSAEKQGTTFIVRLPLQLPEHVLA